MNPEQEVENTQESEAPEVSHAEAKEDRKEDAIKKAKLKKTINIAAAVIFASGLIYWSVVAGQKAEDDAVVEQALLAQQENIGEVVEVLESPHVQVGSEREYNSNPPTSGPHYARPAQWGVYSQEVPEGQIVHSLEHGGIWISYRSDIDEASKKILESIARQNAGSVIVSPREANDTLISVASWGRIANMDVVDEIAIKAYIQFNKNNSPEKLAQ